MGTPVQSKTFDDFNQMLISLTHPIKSSNNISTDWITFSFVLGVAAGDQNSDTLRASNSIREFPVEMLEVKPAACNATLPE